MKKMTQLFLILTSLTAVSAQAAEEKTLTLVVKDGFFTPETIEGPANAKFKLIVKNEGKTAEEFESDELHREKVIQPGKSVTINIGPLPAGTYGFFGEFHPKTAKGSLTLK
ncbi:MAG: cupredoxin domain-containing protein [Oligoflexales bacterium]